MAYNLISDGTTASLYQEGTLIHAFTIPATYSRSGDTITMSETDYSVSFDAKDFAGARSSNERNLWVDAEIQKLLTNEVPAPAGAKLNKCLRVATDVVNATTSFANITGLTASVKSGKKYVFEAHLFSVNDATTTGSMFAIGGVAMTSIIAGAISTVANSETDATVSTGTATAVDTAIVAQTTGSTAVVPTIISGSFVPSADGTVAVKCASEVAVAAGITVKAGSWLLIREADN